MNPIANFFDKFRKLLNHDSILKGAISTSLKSVVGVPIDYGKITLKGKVAHLRVSPLVRNEIYIKKEKILDHIEKNIGTRAITDIR